MELRDEVGAERLQTHPDTYFQTHSSMYIQTHSYTNSFYFVLALVKTRLLRLFAVELRDEVGAERFQNMQASIDQVPTFLLLQAPD